MSEPLILIQAREGSTRFPGKINRLIDHRTMLQVMEDRARATGLMWLLAQPQDWYAAAEQDVLGRFYTALRCVDPEETSYDPIIRLTADTPLLDPGWVLTVLAQYREAKVDWVGTGPEWDGLDVEVFGRSILHAAHVAATEPYDREHVSPWMKRHGFHRTIPLVGESLRWSVDDPDGLKFVQRVFRSCEHCAGGVARHSNAGGSIGGADRHFVWDLHHLERGDLAECSAYDILKERMGGPVYVSG